MAEPVITSGIEALDQVVQYLRLGDNVVWQVDDLDDYVYFARPFAASAMRAGRKCVYLRFASRPRVLEPQDGLTTIEVDPRPGFDAFSSQVHGIIEENGTEVFYVFDSLSALVSEWATDEMVANFFQVTCPFLFELRTITYFALLRGKHSLSAVARIRDTTQILADVYRVGGRMYVHPVKVWDRYSSQMFLPHLVSGASWQPVSQSGDAAAVSAVARKSPLGEDSVSIAPWESVHRKLLQYRDSTGRWAEEDPELHALKQEFSRMLLGTHPEFSRLADNYLDLQDLLAIRDRLIGSGRIGGKAAGMLLARRILEKTGSIDEMDFSEMLEEHDSFYIGSDVFFTFLVNNDLFRLRLHMTRSSHISREEFEEVERRFIDGIFPYSTLEQFRRMLDYYGQAPIIVRSSSLLEDSFGNAFAGKYLREFCANQGTPEERLEALTNAIKIVYASALNPDALSYRRDRGLGESDEQMAILVQRVSGQPYGKYFFPSAAGVAFSRNLYVWSDRIDPEQGVIRLVFGLGTRAVDRVGSDYPRMIAVSSPTLRPEVGLKVAKYSQRLVDVLDLGANELTTVPVSELLSRKDFENLYLYVSTLVQDYIEDPVTKLVDGQSTDFVLTFNNFIKRTDFVSTIGVMLRKLEEAYGQPVDTEFTANVDSEGQVRINLLQCRPLILPGSSDMVSVPMGVASDQVLFRSRRMINGGVVSDVRFIVYIDPKRYSSLPVELKKGLGRLVGAINDHPEVKEGRVIMMGPGRWGSSNIDLGVNVGYSEIDNASVLVEIAREEAGQVPELSYGTHFFQDLVEAQIIYLLVYPDDPEAEFNNAFFELSPNSLLDLVPTAGNYEKVVYVIDVPAAADAHVHVIADTQEQDAVCFIQ